MKPALATLGALVLVAAGGVGGYLVGSGDDGSERSAGSAGAAIPAGWSLCANTREGYAIAYPAGWHTAQLLAEQACSFFDPEPFEIVEGSEFPATALEAHWIGDGLTFTKALESLTDPMFEKVIEREELAIGGRRTVRLETEATGQGLFDKGTRTYAYVVARAGAPFVIKTTFFPGRRGATGVVDRAVRTLRFFTPATGQR